MRARHLVAIVVAAAPIVGCAFASWDEFSSDDGPRSTTDSGLDARTQDRAVPADGEAPADAAVGDVDSGAPITFVQVNAVSTVDVNTKTVSVPFVQKQTAGNLVVVAVGWYNTNVAIDTIKDSKGNVYKLAAGPTSIGPDPVSHAIYYAANVAAAEPNANTVTVEWASPAYEPDVRVAEYSGLDPVSPFDVAAVGSGKGAMATTLAATTKVQRSLLVAAGATAGDYGMPGAGYTLRVITAQTSLLQDRIVNEIGAYTSTAPVTNDVATPPEWVLQLAVFH